MSTETAELEAAARTENLRLLGAELRNQNNRATASPIFAVQERRRIYGIDTGYSDDVVWIDVSNDCREADETETAELEAQYQINGKEPDGWTRTAYIDVWEFVTACFTERGCRSYIESNGHNLKSPRIYAYGSYRNREWQVVREFLLAQSLAEKE